MCLKTYHICISGFRQKESQPTGIVKIWKRLRHHVSPDTEVLLRTWNADWHSIAEFIFHNSVDSPLVHIYAYSWGAGHGAIKLAKYLRKRAILIEAMVLCDPVYYYDWWVGRYVNAIWPWRKIKVPTNVKRVYWFRQETNWPRGHQVIAADKARTDIKPIQGWLAPDGMGHQQIDDWVVFHAACEKIAQGQPLPDSEEQI